MPRFSALTRALIRAALTAVVLLAQSPNVAHGSGAVPVVRFRTDTAAGRAVAQQCRVVWQEQGPDLAARLLPRTATADTVDCFLLDTAAFQQYFGDSLPDWGVGVALSDRRVIALDYTRLPAVGRGVREVFLHEMVHALLFQGSGGQWLPTWLHEGAAMRYAGEWRFTDTVSLVMDGRVPDLAALQGPFPGLSESADRAYRTSLLAVDRLIEDFGPSVIADLVAATAARGDFPTAFAEVTGITDMAFYADFAAAMQLRYGWLVLLTRWPGLFVLLALVLLIGGGAKLIKARRRLSAMGLEEEAGREPGPP